MNYCCIYCAIENISNANATQPNSNEEEEENEFEFFDEETKIHLDLLRPTFESPSTNNRDKCKHRQSHRLL